MTSKTVFITGSSTGIGRASAKLFAARGWNVLASMRHPTDGAELAALDNVLVLPLDVTDAAAIAAALARAVERFGAIDALVNNAGFGAFGPFETAPAELIDRQLATNLVGVFNLTRAVLPQMRERRAGTIINIASIGGLTTMPLNAIYHATKYAVVGFTEGLAYELAPFGVRAKFVAPGGVATDFAGRSLALTFEGKAHPYADQVTKVMAAFERRGAAQYSAPEAIAEVIYTAATDDKEQIRYVAGADAEALLAMRAELGETAYVQEMSRRFGLLE
ncbi:NAD(P)-dependent dehydrogenase (short-subunit alcohol dehydrogenase family) [Oxalobacteraceae bacterium GrIS 1.11]